MNKITSSLLYALYGLAQFFASAVLAWIILFGVDFLYPLWHDIGGIKEGIEQFGPLNRYKTGFAETTREQRIVAFHEINVAVHNKGDGLSSITYTSLSSNGPQALLREPEIVHLQDVANLISFMRWFAVGILLLFPAAMIWFLWRHGSLPSLRSQGLGVAGLLGILSLVIVIFGPENVFNTLHIWIFPDEHQWFFYYQDSLMSTMMLAPVLFGWIGVSWLVISLLIYVLLTLVTRTWCVSLAAKLKAR